MSITACWCPHCKSGLVSRRYRTVSTLRCNYCYFSGHESLFIKANPAEAPKPKYRGIPAGRITIPGYNWKGTRLG